MVGDKSLLITGRGDERLSMLNAHEIVIRRTNFVCPPTMSVLCNKASSDVPRILVKMLQDQETKGIFRITLELSLFGLLFSSDHYCIFFALEYPSQSSV